MKKILKSMLLTSVVLLSGFLLSGCTVSQEKIDEYNRIVQDADILIEGREYTQAIDRLSIAADMIPSKVDAIERIVNIFVIKNRLEDATKLVDESGIELDDVDRAKLYVIVGDAQYKVGNFEKAFYNYQLAKGIDSSNSGACLGMAKSYIQKGSIENARELLNEEYVGDMHIEASLLLSYIEALSDKEEAQDTVKDIEPGDKWREAYTRWHDILDSLNTDELFNGTKLSKEYIDSGYPYLAIALLEPSLEKMSEYVDGIYMLGKAYSEYGEYEKSIEVLENSTSLSDLNQYIYWVLARDYYLLDDINSALSYYDSAISYGANDANEGLYTEYLDILIENELTEKGLEVMKNAERIFKEDWILIYYSNIYLLREDYDKFSYYISKIEYADLDKELKYEYLFLKGEYLIENSSTQEAQRVLDIYWELDQYDPGYNLLVSKLHFKEGDLEEAKSYAKKAIEYDLAGIVSQEAQKLLAQID